MSKLEQHRNGVGDAFWYHRGSIHRRGGPAITYPNGVKFWYINNRYLRAPKKLPGAIHPIMELFL